MFCTALVLFLVAASILAEQMTFEGYKQLSVEVRNKDDALYLRDLGEQYVEIDYWLEPTPGKRTTVVVPPDLVEIFEERVQREGMDIQVINEDISEIIKKSFEPIPDDEIERKRETSDSVIDHYKYHPYEEIRDYLGQLAEKYPDLIDIQQLNHLTHQGRPVDVAILHSPGCGTKPTKPSIIIEAGIHAREWISPASNLYVIEKLLQGYSNDDVNATYMLNNYDWYIVPVTNPDGYEYTFTHNRLWRKNRRQVDSGCYGVDLNRNFDVKWGTTGVSRNCTSSIYLGPEPFSEAETANLRDLFNETYARTIAYVAVHSYSQLLLVPWAYSECNSKPENQAEIDRVVTLMINAIKEAQGETYLHGTPKELLNYAASGSSMDWALTTKPGIYAMTFELRPDGHSFLGFILSADQIVPTGEELYASYVVMAYEMKQ